MIKVGQIGIGHNHGNAKTLAYRKFPELFEVVGFAEENEEWLQKRGYLKAYEGLTRYSVDTLIEKCDALVIETDVWDLTRTAQKCIDTGKHIHLDKPASGTLAEFKHLLDSAESKQLVVQMGYMYRYNPAIQKCIKLIKSGELGDVYSINAEMSTFHPAEYRQWLTNFHGGIMYILGSHLIDLIVYILGKPEKVTSFLNRTFKDGVDAEDNTLAVLEYKHALAKVYVSSVEVNGWGRRQFIVTGNKGTLQVMPIERPSTMYYSKLEQIQQHNKDVKTFLPVQDVLQYERYDTMVQDFYKYVTGAEENPFTYAHDYAVQEVLDQVVGGVHINSKKLL